MAREALRELNCDLVTREHIVNLVRYHGRPPYLLESSNPEMGIVRLSWLLSNRLLYLFALADTRGRRTREMSRAEDTLHLWRETALEWGCYTQRYSFVNDEARFLFFREELSSLQYVPHHSYRCTVTMMSGVPGVGKDAWLSRERPNLPMVSLDEVREELDISATDNQGEVIQTAKEQCREHLRRRSDFAFNATNITSQVRRRWIDLFASYDARIEIIYLEPPMGTILRQNKERPSSVPESVLHRLVRKLEVPTWAEAHSLTFFSGREKP